MIRVNATGCSLVDNLYGNVDFSRENYRRFLSREPGDGGLHTGGLVFAEALADYASESFESLLAELTQGDAPDSSNIGGPGIVPLIHAAQMNDNPNVRYRFAGTVGTDSNGRTFRKLMSGTGFPMDDYRESNLPTPATDVLSDPNWDKGRGERTFINRIGSAGSYGPDELPQDFFDAELLLFGGTALVPPVHDALDNLCRRGREAGAFVMVNTVFDFRNEARMKGRPWPLVEDYGNIDLLGVDREEALRISGTPSAEEALVWFLVRGCGAVMITRGAEDVLLGVGDTGRFQPLGRRSMPTSRYADEVRKTMSHPRDTTGCGDNFIGGVLHSIAHQLAPGEENGTLRPMELNLEEAVASGMVAGGFALSCLGGVFYEQEPGEKRSSMVPYEAAYRRQVDI